MSKRGQNIGYKPSLCMSCKNAYADKCEWVNRCDKDYEPDFIQKKEIRHKGNTKANKGYDLRFVRECKITKGMSVMLGEELRKIRIEKGVSVEALSNNAHISTCTLGRIERGEIYPYR